MARQTKQPLSEVSNQSGVFPEKKSTFKSVCGFKCQLDESRFGSDWTEKVGGRRSVKVQTKAKTWSRKRPKLVVATVRCRIRLIHTFCI